MTIRSRLAITAAILTSVTVCSVATAASIGVNSAPPIGNIIASQLTDLGTDTQDGNRNFSDNGGPLGQTFTSPVDALVGRISILSRGNNASGWNNGAMPFTGSEMFGILIGRVDPVSGAISSTSIETATGLVAAANFEGWLTFDLATPYAVEAGDMYAFSIAQWASSGMYNNGGWFGGAHSDIDMLAGGYAFNLNSSIANAGNNQGMIGSDAAAKRFGFIDPSLPAPGNVQAYAAPVPANYDYIFAVQAVIPEPGVLTLAGLGALCFFLARRKS